MAKYKQIAEKGVGRRENRTNNPSRSLSFELSGRHLHHPLELPDNRCEVHLDSDTFLVV